MKQILTITNNESGLRLDKALVLLLGKSRTFILSLIDDGKVFYEGKAAKASLKVKEGDQVEVEIPEVKPLEIKKEDTPLDIIYEDEDIIIINKPQGLVVHPSFGHESGTLVNAIMAHTKDLSGINGILRPGIIHRIDKNTSGLICIAKNDDAHHFLSAQLKDHTMHREYIALCRGVIKENQGEIDLPIGRSKTNRQKMCVTKENSKEAITYFTVLKRFKEHTLINAKLKTGRTHQIRVHMSYIGYPIEGDDIYAKNGDKLYPNGQLLHAYKLTLIHPKTKEEMTFEAPLPNYFKEIIDNLDNSL